MMHRVFGVAICSAAMLLAACGNGVEEALTARGTVEVREVTVAPLLAGRIVTLTVDEGESVEVGDTIAVLTAPTLASDADAAIGRVAAARAKVRDLEAGAEPQEIAKAEAEYTAKQADAERLIRDRDRLRALLQAGAISPRDFDAAVTAADVAKAGAVAAREALALRRVGSRAQQVAAARAELSVAEAALVARQATNAEYVLTAPVRGIVMARLAEVGDLIGSGGAVVRIGEMSVPWVRIFVPARVLALLSIGDTATIIPPGVENAEIRVAGRIVAINPRAEFVTRTALTEEERADLLFGVKVAILDTTGILKPGMPATVDLHRTPSLP